MSSMPSEEVIGSLRVHELRFKKRDSREEGQALLLWEFNQSKKSDCSQSSRGRGRGAGRGRGKDRGREGILKVRKMRKKRNLLISQRLSVINVIKGVILLMSAMLRRKRKAKKKR